MATYEINTEKQGHQSNKNVREIVIDASYKSISSLNLSLKTLIISIWLIKKTWIFGAHRKQQK